MNFKSLNMKKLFFIGLIILNTMMVFGQAKKPTLMVVPSDVWCNTNNYMTTFDNQGTIQKIPDYKSALQNEANLLLVIGKINTLMADRGFPLKNLESVLKSIEQREAEANMTASNSSGASLAESPLDRLRATAKADIIIQLTWTINTVGPKKTITYNLQGLDAYTNKQIAGAQGTGEPSFSAELPVLLEEAVLANMDNFCAQLQTYFDDLLTNGREVAVDIRVFDTGEMNLETEFNGVELSEIIDDWMAANTVQHRYNKSDASENYIYFEQVRIPLYKINGNAMDTEGFVRELRNYLKQNYQITSKIMSRGLGRAILVIGEK
jgi:hypothetical protein